MPLQDLGKLFLLLGLVFLVIGALLTFAGKLPFLGRLLGDIVIHKKNFTFYFPLTTSIVLSILLTLLIYFIGRK